MAGALVPTPPAATAGNTTLKPEQIARTRQAATDFEAMAVSELLQPMFKTVDTSKGPFGGGAGEAMWKPMLVEEMGKAIARAGGIGIGEAVFQEMLRTQEHRND